MKDNLSLLLALIVGIGVGAFDIAPEWLLNPSLPMIVLSALIIQVGIGVGPITRLYYSWNISLYGFSFLPFQYT